MICNETSSAHKKASPKDEGNDDSPEDSNSLSSGAVVKACPENWFFPGFVSLMFFGAFKESVEAHRVLDLFFHKDPPAGHRKEFSWSAARKKAAARESAVRSIDPSRGMTKRDLLEERKLEVQEDEIKGSQMLLNSKLMMRVHGGMNQELDLLHKIMTQCADVLLNDPTNQFAKLQHKKFKLKF